MILFIIGMAFAGYKTIGQAYGDEEVYPAWTNNLAMIMSMSPVIVSVAYFVVSMIHTRGMSIYPADDFKPKAH